MTENPTASEPPQATTVTVTVNGERRELDHGARVVDLVAELGHDPARPGVAIAVNGEVVGRNTWADSPLRDGDRVEIIAAVQGG